MAIYLGEAGRVEIGRQGAEDPLTSTLQPADVNVASRRFSVNFASAALITGDEVEIKRLPRDQNLQLVAGHDYPDWRGYVNKDPLGGMRLYKTFQQAIEGSKNNALELAKPADQQQIEIRTRSSRERCLGQVTDYEISTQRETIDITTLSQQFRNQYKNGLISGQGRLSCFWEHRLGICETELTYEGSTEFSAYLAHLCIRVQQGAGFRGKYYVFDGGLDKESVWYEADCIVTTVSTSVEPTEIIRSTIDFVTTGPVILKTGFEPALLAQENQFLILQENSQDGLVISRTDL